MNSQEKFRNLKIIFAILSQKKTKKERRGLPLEQNKENKYRNIWLKENLPQEFFVGTI